MSFERTVYGKMKAEERETARVQVVDQITHAPDHLRVRFQGYLVSYYEVANPDDLEEEGYPEGGMSLHDFYLTIGRLWDCTDVLPVEYCRLANLPQGSTYGDAAKKVRETLEQPQYNLDELRQMINGEVQTLHALTTDLDGSQPENRIITARSIALLKWWTIYRTLLETQEAPAMPLFEVETITSNEQQPEFWASREDIDLLSLLSYSTLGEILGDLMDIDADWQSERLNAFKDAVARIRKRKLMRAFEVGNGSVTPAACLDETSMNFIAAGEIESACDYTAHDSRYPHSHYRDWETKPVINEKGDLI